MSELISATWTIGGCFGPLLNAFKAKFMTTVYNAVNMRVLIKTDWTEVFILGFGIVLPFDSDCNAFHINFLCGIFLFKFIDL